MWYTVWLLPGNSIVQSHAWNPSIAEGPCSTCRYTAAHLPTCLVVGFINAPPSHRVPQGTILRARVQFKFQAEPLPCLTACLHLCPCRQAVLGGPVALGRCLLGHALRPHLHTCLLG